LSLCKKHFKHPSLRSKRFRKVFRTFEVLFFSRAKIGASTKKCVTGEGKGEKETLARKPHDFEKPVRPRTEFPDWRGMVVLIAK